MFNKNGGRFREPIDYRNDYRNNINIDNGNMNINMDNNINNQMNDINNYRNENNNNMNNNYQNYNDNYDMTPHHKNLLRLMIYKMVEIII